MEGLTNVTGEEADVADEEVVESASEKVRCTCRGGWMERGPVR